MTKQLKDQIEYYVMVGCYKKKVQKRKIHIQVKRYCNKKF